MTVLPPVVLVEDDAPLAGLLVRYLRRLDLEATCFRQTADALEALRGRPGSILIADLTLGDDDGAELARQALEFDSTLRVLLMSGYPYEPHGFPEGARVLFMPKPFLPSMLQEKLQLLLEAPQPEVIAKADSNLSAKLSPDSDHN
ncbi:MAG: response regulator [Bryobacteraceae bacterium]|nr:response regulator [Bryobacteraceae bacterium]